MILIKSLLAVVCLCSIPFGPATSVPASDLDGLPEFTCRRVRSGGLSSGLSIKRKGVRTGQAPRLTAPSWQDFSSSAPSSPSSASPTPWLPSASSTPAHPVRNALSHGRSRAPFRSPLLQIQIGQRGSPGATRLRRLRQERSSAPRRTPRRTTRTRTTMTRTGRGDLHHLS